MSEPTPEPMSTSVEDTLWKVVAGSPSPEELAAVTVVLATLYRRAEAANAAAPVIPLAAWAHAPAPRPPGSWRAETRTAA